MVDDRADKASCRNVWFLKTSTSGEEDSIGSFCIDKHVIAMGFSLSLNDDLKRSVSNKAQEKLRNDRKYIGSFKDYWKIVTQNKELQKQYKMARCKQDLRRWDYRKSGIWQVQRLAGVYPFEKTNHDDDDNICKDDLVWMRVHGVYYLTRIENVPEKLYRFDSSEEATRLDACNQLCDCVWYPIGTESDIPGAITTYRSGTLCRITTGRETARQFSEAAYNAVMDVYGIKKADRYDVDRLTVSTESFYSLLAPDDVEDLLSFWLFDSKRYFPVLSTNKRGTQTYEFELISLETGHRCYPQVKNADKLSDKAIESLVQLIRTRSRDDEICLFVAQMKECDIKNRISKYFTSQRPSEKDEMIQSKGESAKEMQGQSDCFCMDDGPRLTIYGSEVAKDIFDWASSTPSDQTMQTRDKKRKREVRYLPPRVELWLRWLKDKRSRNRFLKDTVKKCQQDVALSLKSTQPKNSRAAE